MKKFLFKLLFLTQSVIALFFLKTKIHQAWEGFHYDTFNVFHWKKIRFTDAEPNRNFIKTKHILANPKKFNAFVFGSSRVQYLPPDKLPNKIGETELRWYNMTSSAVLAIENYMTLKTFIDNNVSVDMIILGFDDISLYATLDARKKDLMRVPYQEIMENKLKYLSAYLFMRTEESIIDIINSYDEEAHKQDSKLFYDWGGSLLNYDLTETADLKRYETLIQTSSQEKITYAVDSIKAIKDLCAKNNIKLILFTNPLYQTTYRSAVNAGYFEYLHSIAQNCEFYNFSSVNKYTTDPRYYFDWSHYRPAVGLQIEKMIFGTEEERAQACLEADDELWGIKVNAENIDFVIKKLQEQLKEPSQTRK